MINKKAAPVTRAVLVTTEFRGVFFGYIKEDRKLPDEITLKNARNCIRWSSDMDGFLGLAKKGPSENCKIGAKVSEIKLWKITSVTPVTEEAQKQWGK